MAIYKLKQGETLTMTVTAVVLNVPNTDPRYKPSTKFVGRTVTDPDAAFMMTPATAERQLKRHSLTVDTVIGKTIVFAKPGEYLDIELPAAGAPLPPAAPASPAPAASTATKGAVNHGSSLTPEAIEAHEKARSERICLHMKRAIEYFGHPTLGMCRRMTDLNIPATPETTQALITFLFIALNDARIR
jgi:hypothetical protein